MTLNTPRQIRERFPYMFQGRNIGIFIGRGWVDLFARVCEQVDALLGDNKRNFHWTQCKEKFGAARWYWSIDPLPGEMSQRQRIKISNFNPDGSVTRLNPDDPALVLQSTLDKIDAVVEAAQEQTQSVCICCGAPGAGVRSPNGMFEVLCRQHAEESRRTGRAPDTHFDQDEY